MSTEYLEVRPRFQKRSFENIETLREKMKLALEESNETIIGKIDHEYITLEVPHNERHFWSPHLSITLEREEEGTVIRGLCGPRPEIWMGFMFVYFLAGFLVLIISIIGLSQYNLGLSAYILWFIPFIIGGVMVMWFSSRTGQRLAKPQMEYIYDFLNKNLLSNTEDVDHD